MDHQKLAVDTGYWPLFRYDPRRTDAGNNPLQLDSPAPKVDLIQLTRSENRYKQIARSAPARAAEFEKLAQNAVHQRFALYQQLAAQQMPANGNGNGKAHVVAAPAPAANGEGKPAAAVTKSITSG
jgi:pyruvate-ferredoxin/flavodoxin oxidoreductase